MPIQARVFPSSFLPCLQPIWTRGVSFCPLSAGFGGLKPFGCAVKDKQKGDDEKGGFQGLCPPGIKHHSLIHRPSSLFAWFARLYPQCPRSGRYCIARADLVLQKWQTDMVGIGKVHVLLGRRIENNGHGYSCSLCRSPRLRTDGATPVLENSSRIEDAESCGG